MASLETARRTVLALYPKDHFEDEAALDLEVEIVRARLTIREVFAPLLDNPDPLLNLEFETAVCSTDEFEWKSYFDDWGCAIMLRRLQNAQLRSDIIDVENDTPRSTLMLLKNELSMVRDGAHYARVIAAEEANKDVLQEVLKFHQ